MIMEANEVKMQVFNTIIIQNILWSNQLTKVQIIQQACFSKGEELLIIQSWLFSLNCCHWASTSLMTEIESFLIGSSKTVTEWFCILQKKVPPLIVIYHHFLSAHAANTILQLYVLVLYLILSCS